MDMGRMRYAIEAAAMVRHQSACACVAEKTYIHALVEIVQMASWKPGELNRGVRAVARIKRTATGLLWSVHSV
jgi:hypothetical protein